MKTNVWLAASLAVLVMAARPARADPEAAAHLDRQPQVIKQARPVYPYSLRRSGNKGEVLVDFIVDPKGDVVRADVVRSSHPDFEAPAVEAVLQWKFKPGLKNGQPVFVHMAVPIYFQLTDPNPYPGMLHGPHDNGVDVWRVPTTAPKDLPPEYQYDVPPKPILASAPVYPFELLTKGVKGKAEVLFSVDPQGRAHVIKLVSASLPEFGAAATAMIEAWRFEPATKGGKPSWAILRKAEVFDRDASDFPLNDSADRLLSELKRSPCPILVNSKELDRPLMGRFLPSPAVPQSVRSENARAEALIEFVVDHAGHAQLPRIISASNPDFGWAAATAVGRWQYTQPTKNGRPVDVFARVPIVFSPGNSPAPGP